MLGDSLRAVLSGHFNLKKQAGVTQVTDGSQFKYGHLSCGAGCMV